MDRSNRKSFGIGYLQLLVKPDGRNAAVRPDVHVGPGKFIFVENACMGVSTLQKVH
jgi:hypothetical protein